MVAILLTLPIGWKNSLPIICTDTETVANLDNSDLRCNRPFRKKNWTTMQKR